MEPKLRVLMELHPCFYGFSGIPQETRLLFSIFSDLNNIKLTGLLDANRTSNTADINGLSNFILATLDSANFSDIDRFRTNLNVAARIASIILKNLLGVKIPIASFNSHGFEDFLWERLFAKTLTTQDFTKITNAAYCLLGLSRITMSIAVLSNIFLKINTKEHQVFIAQTPFPGRISKNTQLIVRYHDAIPVFVPHLIDNPRSHQALHYKSLCDNAETAYFACTSNTVRNDLLQMFPKLEQRSVVIHDIISPHYFIETTTTAHLAEIINNYAHAEWRQPLSSDTFSYLLMASTIEPRKNHIRLIRAWELVRNKLNLNIKLVLVGELGWQTEPVLAVMRPWQQRGQLFHLQQVPVEYLRLLYTGAACVVCPSVKEGFDLSGIEAMACGSIVAASDIAVHREVYETAAIYFDPYSFTTQADVIECILGYDDASVKMHRQHGLQQAQKYQPHVIKSKWENLFLALNTDKIQ